MRVVTTVGALIIVIGLLCLVLLAAQDSGNKQVGTAPGSATTCQPTRTVATDGTIVVQNRDCSVTKTTKQQILKAPDGESTPAQPGKNPAVNAEKLREMRPDPLPAGVDDPKLAARYTEAMNGYFEYYIAGYEHRQRVFRWQLLSSKIIFVIVTLLVFSGVCFAALQFYAGMRQAALAPTSAAAAASSTGSVVARPPTAVEQLGITTFSASSKGIEVSSPVLGIIILVISLAFFYLYLVYVYPISELF